jgi:hypothetical protein
VKATEEEKHADHALASPGANCGVFDLNVPIGLREASETLLRKYAIVLYEIFN